jgi:hypothetical protein
VAAIYQPSCSLYREMAARFYEREREREREALLQRRGFVTLKREASFMKENAEGTYKTKHAEVNSKESYPLQYVK